MLIHVVLVLLLFCWHGQGVGREGFGVCKTDVSWLCYTYTTQCHYTASPSCTTTAHHRTPCWTILYPGSHTSSGGALLGINGMHNICGVVYDVWWCVMVCGGAHWCVVVCGDVWWCVVVCDSVW